MGRSGCSNVWAFPRRQLSLPASEPQVVASLHAAAERRRLWKAAIKWPMYAVAVMPVLLAAGWRLGQGLPVRPLQLALFLLAAVLLLAWENLANDVFDADTGVDTHGKPHSVVNLLGRRDRVALLANGALVAGLVLMALVALRSTPLVLALVLACCGIGYAYRGRRSASAIAAWVNRSAGLPSGRWPPPPACWPWGRQACRRCPGGRLCCSAQAPRWPPPWCCSVPTSTRWRRTRPTASARR